MVLDFFIYFVVRVVLQKMGPEYNSDISGDGPVTFLVTPYCELFLKHSALSPYLLRTHLGLELCRDHNSLSFWQADMRDCELFLKHSALSPYLLRTCMGLGLCRDHNSLSFWQAAMPDEYYHTLNLQYGNLYMNREISSAFRSPIDGNQQREAPQWTDFGPQYSSDCSGDGPVTHVQSNVGETIQTVQPQQPSVSPATDALPHKDIVDIPEFDPNNNNSLLPNWMRYDPDREGPKRYSCIVCECEVSIKQTLKHVNGKRHTSNLDTKGHLCHESITRLTTLLRSTYNRDLRMLTITNISTMSDVIHLLLDADDSFISVASFIADARIMCLSLVTATICINIDRTVFQETDMLKNCKPLKELFQGSTRVMGGDV